MSTTAPMPEDPGRRLRPYTLALALLCVLAAGYAAWRQDWTYDEPLHVAWAERFLDTGETERFSQNLFNTKTTILIANVASRRVAERLGASEPRTLRLAARLATVGWLAALLAVLFAFVRAFFGETAAHLATAATALDPNLVAHGSLATSDVAFALGTLLTLGAGIRFAAQPSAARGAALGAAIGFAFAAKFNAVLLLPALALLPLAFARPPGRDAAGKIVLGAASAIAAAWLVLSAAYLFRGLPAEPLSANPWRSVVFRPLAAVAPGLSIPLPTGFLTGLDFALRFGNPGHSSKVPEWNIVVLGRRHPRGVWYYFGLLWLLKTPVLVLAALAIGIAHAARSGVLVHHPPARYLAASLLVWLVYLSFFFRVQIGYRLALMCIPVAAALAAAGLVRARWWTRRLAAIVALAALAENAPYVGNPLAFTNAAVQPKREVFRLISNSNIDWGQNREKIAGWISRARGTAVLDPVHVVPGHNAISLNLLAGVWDFDRHRWLREHVDPGGHYGHTYVWFDVDDDLFGRFLQADRRLSPSEDARGLCAADGLRAMAPGSRVDFSAEGPLAPGEAWIVCVETRKRGQFGLCAVQGQARFAPYRKDARWQTLEKGQVAWYVLEPGMHVLALTRIPNHRAWLPNLFVGRWLVREHGVSLGVRAAALDGDGVLRGAPATAAETPRARSAVLMYAPPATHGDRCAGTSDEN